MVPLAEQASKGVRRAAYTASQLARIAWFTGHYAVGRRLMGPLTLPGEAPYAEQSAPLDRERLKNAFRDIFKTDWRNIERGEYKLPRDMRRLPSIAGLLRTGRDYLVDAEKVARRRFANGHSEVFAGDTADLYPRYYLQNFHYQTDGWLSESSAARYDMQVETLFTGAAGPMRRQALPAVRAAIAGRDPAQVSLLDIGCGTGVFLEEIKNNWPMIEATALDLSSAYLGRTRARLGNERNFRFVVAKAEETGLADASYDIVTSVYLFHELPPAIRREVARETARLLKPGGTLIHVDTIQYGDEPGLDILLENFPRGFHEPYYDSYCREDLAGLFAEAGLSKKSETLAYLTKVSVFEKA